MKAADRLLLSVCAVVLPLHLERSITHRLGPFAGLRSGGRAAAQSAGGV